MTAQQRTLAEVVVALLIVVGGYFGWRQHERAVGALNVTLHVQDSTARVERDTIQQRAQAAQEAASQAEAAKTLALRQVKASEALRAKTDSQAKASEAEHGRAIVLLHDSLATVSELRGEVGRLLAVSVADSVAHQAERLSAAQATVLLLSTLHSDSLALSAEQQHSKALQALNQTLAQEITVLKKSRPSTFGNVVRGLAFAGGGYLVGRVVR